MSTRAELTSGKATENDKIALLNLKVDGLMRKLEQERPKLKQERFKMVEAIPVVQERIDRVGQRVNATVLKAQELGIAVLDLQLSEPDGAVLIVQPEEHNKHRFPELIDFASKLKIRLVLSSPSSQ